MFKKTEASKNSYLVKNMSIWYTNKFFFVICIDNIDSIWLILIILSYNIIESQIQEKLEKLMPNMMIIEMKRKSEGISWVAEVSVEKEEISGPMVPKNVKLVDLLSLL